MHRFRHHDHGYTSPCHIPLKRRGDDCSLDRDGYSRASSAADRSQRMHRLVYQRLHGQVPDGMVLDHLCGNRACCNPAHLEAVTQAVNVRRSRLAQLSPEQVARIKELRKAGMRPTTIGRLFGVTQSHVSHICSNRYWRTDGAPSYRTIKLRQAKACAGQ